MSRVDLAENVNDISSDQNSLACLYAVVKDGNIHSLKKVDIDSDLQFSLKELFVCSLKSSSIFNPEVVIKNLTECDDRRNIIAQVDFDLNEPFHMISELDGVDGIDEIFNPETDIDNLKAFVIDIGTQNKQILIYKHIYPLEIFKKTRFAVIFKSKRMEKFTEQLLTISPSFQMIRTKGKTYVLDLPFIEKNAKFQLITKEKANKACEIISTIPWIANAAAFKELVDDMSFARKLSRITQDSPVIKKNISSKKIIDFCKNFPSIKDKIRFNDDETKILLDTKISKNIVLKIFLDDMLKSELTESHYESVAKDNVD